MNKLPTVPLLMIKPYFVFLFFFWISDVFAQSPSCDGNRYINPVFNFVDVVSDVSYGQNNTMGNILQNLRMDIYQPKSDTAIRRPLIIFLHGGAFIQGDKQNLRDLCMHFAIRGYVAAAINYRLIDIIVTDTLIIDEGLVQAMGDTKAAFNFFYEDAAIQNIYRIDTNYIFLSGVSAGGVSALHAAYLDSTDNIPANLLNIINENGGFSGNSYTFNHHTLSIKGVVNYSGALLTKGFISAGEPSLFSVHDDGDTVVPCSHGKSQTFPFPIYCDGSCVLQQEAYLKGIYNELVINHSNSHCGYFSIFPFADTVIQRTADFLYEQICPAITQVADPNLYPQIMQLYPNPAEETLTVRFPFIPSHGEQFQLFNMMGFLLKKVR